MFMVFLHADLKWQFFGTEFSLIVNCCPAEKKLNLRFVEAILD